MVLDTVDGLADFCVFSSAMFTFTNIFTGIVIGLAISAIASLCRWAWSQRRDLLQQYRNRRQEAKKKRLINERNDLRQQVRDRAEQTRVKVLVKRDYGCGGSFRLVYWPEERPSSRCFPSNREICCGPSCEAHHAKTLNQWTDDEMRKWLKDHPAPQPVR